MCKGWKKKERQRRARVDDSEPFCFCPRSSGVPPPIASPLSLFLFRDLIYQRVHRMTYLRRSAALRRTRSARASPVEEGDSS